MTRQINPPPSLSDEHPLLDGVRHFARPEYDLPDIPDDLTMCGDNVLMGMFTKAVAWQNFADTIATEAEIREARYEDALATVESDSLLSAWRNYTPEYGPKGGIRNEFSATVAKAQRDTDPAVVSARDEWQHAKAARKRAQTVRDNAERLAQLLSRELSRRIGRDSLEKRAGRFGA